MPPETMKKLLPITLLFVLVWTALPQKAFAWGFWAHQRINRLAVFTLPPEMLVLYKKNIDYITVHAVDPDKRRYAVDGEAPRHYIDVDHYGEYPFDMVPRRWKDAVEKYGEEQLNEYGIVPWHIYRMYYRLVDAFKDGNLERVMKLSADMGHYIADSNVPLHTTENYNGQMTGQKGIHGLWESRLPELFGEDYNYFLGRAKYVDNVLDEAWSSVLEAHICLDSVFGFELELTDAMASDKKYSFENRGNVLVKAYSKDFCDAYHERLAGQVERRLRTSIIRVGSIWYTAWVDAGQPDLKKLMEQELEVEENKYDRKINITDRESNAVGAVPNAYEAIFGSCCGHGMESCQGSLVREKSPESSTDMARQSDEYPVVHNHGPGETCDQDHKDGHEEDHDHDEEHEKDHDEDHKDDQDEGREEEHDAHDH